MDYKGVNRGRMTEGNLRGIGEHIVPEMPWPDYPHQKTTIFDRGLSFFYKGAVASEIYTNEF